MLERDHFLCEEINDDDAEKTTKKIIRRNWVSSYINCTRLYVLVVAGSKPVGWLYPVCRYIRMLLYNSKAIWLKTINNFMSPHMQTRR